MEKKKGGLEGEKMERIIRDENCKNLDEFAFSLIYDQMISECRKGEKINKINKRVK